ncbi:MAG TPA: hypothetical protein VK502_04635 [Candidatus Saccharimonadales bacterium]|nr:hypothetical protein [Candidatus Saccharimonadales bacterium]
MQDPMIITGQTYPALDIYRTPELRSYAAIQALKAVNSNKEK